MSAPINSFQNEIKILNECIVYLDVSKKDIHYNMDSMKKYVKWLHTPEDKEKLNADIQNMSPTVTILLFDISILTSDYRKILDNASQKKTIDPETDKNIIILNNRLVNIHNRKKALFKDIIDTSAKYKIKSIYLTPNESKKLNQSKQSHQLRQTGTPLESVKEETEEDINAGSSGGARRQKRMRGSLRKKRTRSLRKKHTRRRA